jgi:hypothetical protein
MPYTSKVSSPGISVDTNNDGTANGRVHRIRNAGNFNGFSIANGVLTIQGPTSGTSAGGSDTHVQFNDGGAIAGESTMIYNKTSNTLTVSNLTVSGELIVTTTTTLNSNTVNIGDNIIVLNSDITGSGNGTDGGIEIGRGDDANAQLLWKEATTSWDFDGYNVGAVGRVYAAGSTTPVYSFTTDTNTGIEHAASDAIGLMVNAIRRVHIGVNGVSIVGLDGTTAAAAAGSNQALLVDDIVVDTQTISTSGSNKNLKLAPHGSGSIELAGVSSNATAIATTVSAHNVVGTSISISAGSTVAGTTSNIAGGSLTLSAGQGKGSGAGGDIVFKTANAGSSASTMNALATVLTLSDDLSALFTGAVTVNGNLTVSGTTTQVNTTNTAVADQLVVINDGEAQNGVDNGSGLAGIEVDRGADSGTPNDHAFFIFNEDGDTWNARVGTAPTGLVASALNLSGLTASNIVITDGSKNLVSATTGTYPSLTELAYVKGVTSAVQTQLDAKQATITGSATTIDTESLTASRAVISNGSSKIAVSATTSTELGYVSGVSSAIQTQIDAKAPIANPTFTGEIGIGSVNVSETELGILEGATLTTTELNYVDGVSSAIQTQLDAKQATITGSATTIDTESLTASRAVISNGSSKIAVSATTSTELGYVNGVTSAIQTQLGTKEQVGKKTMWIPSSAMSPTSANGCSNLTTVATSANQPDMTVLDFAVGQDEFAQFSVAFPKSWNEGTVTYQVFWSGIAATSNCAWTLQGVAIPNNTSIDVAYGTAIVVTDAAQGAVEELNVSAESGAITIGGGPAVDELCYFRIGRDVSGGNMNGDARLHGIKLFYTTDAVNDA